MKKAKKPKKAKSNQPSHDYTCDNCGKPAVYNVQDWWRKYEITPDGDFIEVDDWEGGTNEFYCEDCRQDN